MIYDVIVVGMGPGGSAAARSLAAGGARVLGIDRQGFPRVKPCGGALSVKIDRLLDPDFHQMVERVIHGVRITCNGEAWSSHRSPSPIVHMVMRPSCRRRGGPASRSARGNPSWRWRRTTPASP
ncbi:MAG: hypothetical protein ACE5IM_08825 [Nitrospinota bacterium]